MRTLRSSLVGIAIATLLLGSPVSVVGQEDTSATEVPLGGDVSYFTGTEACTSELLGSAVVDGVEQAEIRYTCETVTTDPRFEGTEELVLIAYDAGTVGGPWTAAGSLTQDTGAWRGQGLGVWDAGASPLGTPGVPFNYGEMTYIGEGAYEGLVLHYYVAGTDEELALMGWIAPSE
jgi:hypothetical protein